ncbi:PucR family transcriptional regulator [Streptomyces arenae]|uniref:PucR family transcriptional regulator n=1 Tax=Streptomyces arenae TaxID=29301 RepID=UPI00265A0BCF|nr:helix-turn-helix domain-containing protein [Streptomyces arenae]MCG7208242.1 helix-turn-helix domain-containing protein [Streptomyces arenae]
MTGRSERAAAATAALRAALERIDPDAVVQRMEPALRRTPEHGCPARDFGSSALRVPLRRHVDLLLHWIVRGTPPDSYVLSEMYEQARECAAAGQPLDGGLLLHLRAASVFWDAVLGLVTEEDRGHLAGWTDQVRRYLDSHLDLVTRVFTRAYADQADLPSAQGERRARTLFDRIRADLPVTVEDQERAARLGFDLTPPYMPFVVLLDGSVPAERADLAARLRTAGALAFVEDVQVSGVTGSAFDWSGFMAGRRLLLAQGPATGRTGLRTAVDTLRLLVVVASRSRRHGQVRTEEFLPELLLARSPELADAAARRVFGPLADGGHDELTATLTCLAEKQFDSASTSAALHLHRNTLLYRVKQIEKLIGLDLQRHGDRTLVWLAVRWARVSSRPAGSRSALNHSLSTAPDGTGRTGTYSESEQR